MIASLVPPSDENAIGVYRDKYKPDNWKITIAPHITFARPAESSLEPKDAVRVFLGSEPPLKSFRVVVDGVGTFLHPDSSTVYAKPRMSPELERLHQFAIGVHRRICHPFTERYQFEPHITIVKDIIPERARELEKVLREEHISFSYLIDRLQLLKKDDHDDFWQQVAELKL